MFSTVKLTLYQACQANKRQQLKDLSTMYIRHLGTTQQQQNTTKKRTENKQFKMCSQICNVLNKFSVMSPTDSFIYRVHQSRLCRILLKQLVKETSIGLL